MKPNSCDAASRGLCGRIPAPALAVLCAVGLAIGTAGGVRAQTSPLREKLEGPLPAKPSLVPYKVEEPKKDRPPSAGVSPPPASALPPPPPPPAPASRTVTVTCPASTSEGGGSQRFPGWTFESAWSRYMGLDAVNPPSMGAGAVVECLYGFHAKAPDFPAYFLTLRHSLGAGITAQMCAVNGSTVSCTGRAPVTCPNAGVSEHGSSRTWAGWLFETTWADQFVVALVTNPPSMTAGATVECRYGSRNRTAGSGVLLRLRRSLERGGDAGTCRLDAARMTATCARPS